MLANRTAGDVTWQKQTEECRGEADLEYVDGRLGHPLMARDDVHAVPGCKSHNK